MVLKIFTYRLDGFALEPVNDQLKLSSQFNREDVIDQINGLLVAQNFKVDERAIRFIIKDENIVVEGIANEIQEPRVVGFKF